MNKLEAVEILKKNIQETFKNTYNITIINDDIILKNKNNPNNILYNIKINKSWFGNIISVKLYNGNLTKIPILDRYIHYKKDKLNLME